MTVSVFAPCPGRVLPLSETPDPVFATEMMGPGVTIDPDPDSGEVTVVSPIAGKVMVVHPHAFVVMGAGGVAVLVHLGIDTVRLKGAGFELLTEKGATVSAGDPMVRWDPAAIAEQGMSTMVPVVAMERQKGSVPRPAAGAVAVVGEVLFTVTP
ncbi:PTS sugar transporter subunit IIA [Nocardioides sp. T2.26MG-1]|uniref:PTS sugar transporter subunit IIA n=1 Tax=Nocardioides sp. T2.26MG-1 TaxID=3041166 RepID=UPI002477B3F7|nr:PTS glucose transporter subunit IIA [Nocardioides sp. T2.26MG-1]CAI9402572.1 PTS system glucose-specific EIIA component [Nocardioides sp. T2.26MG-1]